MTYSKPKKTDKEISCRVLIDSTGKMVGEGLSELKYWMERHANSYVDVTLSEMKIPRSLSQNAYLHAIFAYFAEWSGDSPENVKRIMKEMWVPTGNKIIHAQGRPWEWIEIETEETHKMEKARMSWFVDRVYNTMCGQGYIPPTPDQVLMEQRKKGVK